MRPKACDQAAPYLKGSMAMDSWVMGYVLGQGLQHLLEMLRQGAALLQLLSHCKHLLFGGHLQACNPDVEQ